MEKKFKCPTGQVEYYEHGFDKPCAFCNHMCPGRAQYYKFVEPLGKTGFGSWIYVGPPEDRKDSWLKRFINKIKQLFNHE